MNDVLGVEVIHSLGSLPRYLDHVEELKLRLIHVQMLYIDKYKFSAVRKDRSGEDLVKAGSLAPLRHNRQLAFLGDATHEEQNVDMPGNI